MNSLGLNVYFLCIYRSIMIYPYVWSFTPTGSTSDSNKTRTEKPASVSEFLPITDQRIVEMLLQKMMWFWNILSEFSLSTYPKNPPSVLYQTSFWTFDLTWNRCSMNFIQPSLRIPAPAKGIVGLDAAWRSLEHWNMISTSITSSCNYYERWISMFAGEIQYVCCYNKRP